jgi:hypothetical protein
VIAGLGAHVYVDPLPLAGAQYDTPAPDPPPLPVIADHVPGEPVVVQNERFCPAVASVAK